MVVNLVVEGVAEGFLKIGDAPHCIRRVDLV